ncbi:peptide ABC transporter permease [Roseateles aquatilis]|uniref:Peptide ABC transporter permease n=1 Tax=Roseateles aquatilis TaxID=431061 RepID=A0A246JGU5_9BURK|nr:ABC transporter permease [Roseateles aquatilis]OWQ91876.1 peptide ABC transporter permease [Roseateles aquatilis]
MSHAAGHHPHPHANPLTHGPQGPHGSPGSHAGKDARHAPGRPRRHGHGGGARRHSASSPWLRLPPWAPWFLGRLLTGLGVVVAISIVVFVSTQALPSDPARIILGPEASEATIAVLREQLGLNGPIVLQYLHWAGQMLSGDLGRSIDSNVPVGELMRARFANSLLLTACVTLTALPIALVLGVALALRRDRAGDRLAIAALVLLKAVPGFAIAIVLVLLFSTSVFKVLPAASLLDPDRDLPSQWRYLVLPTATLALSVAPYLLRLVRASMIEVLESDHVAAARLRGIPERRIVWRHALPNALIPAIQGVAMTLRVLFGGALIAEVVFSYPGIGSTLNAAIEMRDMPMIQAIVLVITVAIVAINLAADLATVLLTPRLRTAGRIKARSPGLRHALRLGRGHHRPRYAR